MRMKFKKGRINMISYANSNNNLISDNSKINMTKKEESKILEKKTMKTTKENINKILQDKISKNLTQEIKHKIKTMEANIMNINIGARMMIQNSLWKDQFLAIKIKIWNNRELDKVVKRKALGR